MAAARPSLAKLATATAATATSVYSLHKLWQLASSAASDTSRLCGGAEWAWTPSNECFRTSFLWPGLILVSAGGGSAYLAIKTLLRKDQETAPQSARRPPGKVVLVDNRASVGALIALLTVALEALTVAWTASSTTLTEQLLACSMGLGSLLVAVTSVFSYIAFLRSRDRLSYYGLFPSYVPKLSGILLALGMGEMYYSFFTPETSDVPFWFGATSRSRFVVATTALNFVLIVLFSIVQQGAAFLRPDMPEDVGTEVPSRYEAIESSSTDLELTPLAQMRGRKQPELIDTPEPHMSWYSKLMFSWSSDFLRKGTKRQLDYPDMYVLEKRDTPVPSWRRYLKHRKAGRPLMTTLLMTFAPELLAQLGMAVLSAVLKFAGPFFLQRILRSIEILGSHSDASASKSLRAAYLDAFALLFFSILVSQLTNQVLWIGRHIGMRIKGMLVAELSTKTLRRRGKGSWEDEKKASSGEEDEEDEPATAQAAADGKIMNLLTADFQRVTEVAAYMDQLYSMPLSLVVGIWYMYQLLGVSALVGMTITVVFYPLSKVLFSYMTKIEEKLNAISDERITVITELLQGIKAVKLFGWESRFVEKADQKRERQLSYQWKMVHAWIRVMAASALAPMIVLVIILAMHVVGFGHQLTAEIAFTSISVFQLIRITFEHFPGFLNWAIGAYVSLGRIESYLSQPEVQSLDERVSRDQPKNALGFVDADLVWDAASSDADESVSQASSDEPTKVSTPQAENAASKTDVADENTPLLPSTSAISDALIGKQPEAMAVFGLKNITVEFPQGGLSVIAGPTGSGKSSLLSALIGEMSLVRGTILLPTVDPSRAIGLGDPYGDVIKLSEEGIAIHDIAYVAQEAWLRNATIRENILFGEPYNQDRYEEVLRVCALKPDLRILAAGDQTEIGERGVTLSGGQKQRVALARAVYSDRSVLLIDDCLSAVDAHTAKHILMECLLNKTSLMQGRTRVLVTHHVSMCLPYAQYITVMREGEIALKGNPQELQALGKFSSILAELDTKNGAKSDDDDSKGKAVEDIEDIEDEGSAERAKAVNDMTSEDDYNTERLRKLAVAKGLDPNADLSAFEGTLIEDEEREAGSVKSEVWFTYFKAAGDQWYWTISLSLLASVQMFNIMQDYWIRIWVQSVKEPSASIYSSVAMSPAIMSDMSRPMVSSLSPVFAVAAPATDSVVEMSLKQHTALYWLGIYFLIGVLSIVWRAVQMIYLYTGAIRASRTLHASLLRAVVHATPRFFDSTPLGRIINRFSRDMQTLDEWSMDILVWWMMDILAVLCIFAIISYVTPAFVLIAIGISVTYAGIGYYYLAASRELKRIESNTMSPLLSLFGELILGVTSIRAFGLKKYYIKEAINRINAQNQPFYQVWAANRWLCVRVDLAGAVVAFACSLFILMNLRWMDAGLAGFALSYALTFSDRMLWVIRNYSQNELNMNAVERITQYLKTEQEASAQSTPENKPASNWPKTGDLEIEDLVIEYVPNVPVLHGLNMSIKHGEKIGVVGRTGAGKSTLSLAFLRFIEAAKGRIVLDGVDIAKIGLEDLRRNVTIIPQDPVLFNGTIRFNLDPFGEYPDEIVWDALRRAHLVRERGSQTASSATSVFEGKASDSSLERMAGIFNSLEAEIKENGQNLSLGQRQLVALARALVRRSRLIVMDEATASVDFDTDDRIQRTIRGSEFANSTLFCIAHRLRTIIDYDRVLVLDKGKVAEFDTPANLLEKQDGIFRSMCEKSGEVEFLFKAAQRKAEN